MFVAQVVGSTYNISYNLVLITPLLTELQEAAFTGTIQVYNLAVYPFLAGLWAWVVFSLAKGNKALRCRVVNLPCWATVIGAAGWLGSIPVLLWNLWSTGDPLGWDVKFHLPVSIFTAMAIALSLGYLSIDWLRHRLIFPYFFEGSASPAHLKGGIGLSVTGRGALWIISASLCPIVALLLLLISPSETSKNLWFAVGVASSGIIFALFGTFLLRRLVADPVRELGRAARSVGEGDLEIRVDNLRADEFGVLAEDFNTMVEGLREREEIRAKFGMHVGEKIAQELLKNEAELAGVERTVSVLFADIRDFTPRCENLDPKRAVQFLNLFHTAMTEVIDHHGGIVNQIAGDGFMSLFGATGVVEKFPDDAVAAGQGMLRRIESLNEELDDLGFDPVKIGIGINTGPTVVGTIGSRGRKEYTAIGDTVNTAARIEGMTKDLCCPLLVSKSTWDKLAKRFPGKELPPRAVRGREEKIVVFAVDDSD